MSGASAVQLFLGESALVDPLVQKAADAVLGKSAQSLDFEVIRHGERPMSEIEAALRQVGMFAANRCIWLRGFVEAARRGGQGASTGGEEDEDESPGGEGGDELLSLLEAGVPDGTTLLVSASGLDARGRLFKWFAKHATVRDERVAGAKKGRLSPEAMRAAVEERLAAAGVRRPGPGVVDEIVRRSGSVVGETLQEVDRLVLAQRDPGVLTVDQVRAGMRDLGDAWVFDLTEAIGARDLAAAEGLMERLLAEGQAPLALVALAGNHVAQLLEARAVFDTLPKGAMQMRGADFLRGPGASLPEGFRRRYPSWRGYFLLKASANFAPAQLRRLHADILGVDLALKSSRTSPVLLLSRFLQAACIVPSRR